MASPGQGILSPPTGRGHAIGGNPMNDWLQVFARRLEIDSGLAEVPWA